MCVCVWIIEVEKKNQRRLNGIKVYDISDKKKKPCANLHSPLFFYVPCPALLYTASGSPKKKKRITLVYTKKKKKLQHKLKKKKNYFSRPEYRAQLEWVSY